MPRLFTGLEIPPEIGETLSGLRGGLPGARWIDPVTSLAITLIIGLGSWRLLRDALKMGLLAVPAGIDQGQVRAFLQSQPGVTAVHDLHIWPMSTTQVALTCHLVMPGGCPGDGFLHDARDMLQHVECLVHQLDQAALSRSILTQWE